LLYIYRSVYLLLFLLLLLFYLRLILIVQKTGNKYLLKQYLYFKWYSTYNFIHIPSIEKQVAKK